MNSKYLNFLACIFIISFYIKYCESYYIQNGLNRNLNISKIAFGSCFSGFLSERDDIFKTINSNNPDLFIWMGDLTYLDELDYKLSFGIIPDFNLTEAEIRYNTTYNNIYYKLLRKNKPIIGTWDDHDFGYNNGEELYPYKDLTKNLFLNFLESPIEDIRRKSNRGVYTSYSFGNGYKSFKIIMLDLRYNFRGESYIDEDSILLKDFDSGKYNKNKIGKQMMDKNQWTWLENELKSEETFTFIVSGVQFLPIDSEFIFEHWLVKEREKFVNLLGKIKKSGVILLSGDIHLGQILRTKCIHPTLGYHLYEFTSSGLSHYDDFYYFFVNYIFKTKYSISHLVNDMNFGEIDFNWGNSKQESSVNISIIDIEKNTRLKKQVYYSNLIHNENHKYNLDCAKDFVKQRDPDNNFVNIIKNKFWYYLSFNIHLLLFLLNLYFLTSLMYYIIKLILKAYIILKKISN